MTSRRGVAVVVVSVAALVVWLWSRHPAHEAKPMHGSAAEQHASGSRPRVAPAGDGRRVAGVVTLDGKPVEGATVRLVGLFAEQTLQSDASGRFAFTGVAVAGYIVAAERTHSTGATVAIDLRSPTDVEDLALVLHACDATLEGFVRDASGGPIAHARVAESLDGMRPGAGTETADNGHYELCIPPQDVHVMVRADGYAQTAVTLLSTGHLHHDFALVPEAVIAGRVVSAVDQAAIAGADVLVEPETYEPMFGLGKLHAITDDTGHFRITGARPGRHDITATAPHLTTAVPVPVITEVGTPADVTVELVASASVRGVVREAGAPVRGARVVLVPSRPFAIAGEHAVTQTDGTFVIERVLPGEYDVYVDDFSQSSRRAIEVAHADVTGVTLDVESLPSIEGRVTYQGSPVDGATVNVGAAPTITDAQGHFALHGLAEGTVRVYAESKRLGAFTPGPEITLGAHEHKTGVEIALDLTGSIAGIVVDQDGAPVGGVVVSFSLLHGSDYGTATTAEDGTFKATALSGGGSYLYEVRAAQDSALTFHSPDGKRFAPIAVRDGSTRVSDVRIRIRYDRLAISGHVTSSSGEPLSDVVVRATPETYAVGNGAAAVTDASGAFSIRGLQAGRYVVVARSSRGTQTTHAPAGRSDVTLAIAAAATITGTLEDFHEVPSIWVRGSEGMFRPRVDGVHFEVLDIPSGRYVIIATAPDGNSEETITVKDGEHASVTLHRRGVGSISGTVVTESGAPVAGARCSYAGDVSGTAVTDSSGTFRFEKLLASHGPVDCFIDEHSYAYSDVVVTPDQVTNVRLIAHVEAGATPTIGLTLEPQFDEQIVTAVVPGGAADKAGLQPGDIIVDVDGAPAGLFRTYVVEMIESRPAGAAVKLTFERGDKRETTTLIIPGS